MCIHVCENNFPHTKIFVRLLEVGKRANSLPSPQLIIGQNLS